LPSVRIKGSCAEKIMDRVGLTVNVGEDGISHITHVSPIKAVCYPSGTAYPGLDDLPTEPGSALIRINLAESGPCCASSLLEESHFLPGA